MIKIEATGFDVLEQKAGKWTPELEKRLGKAVEVSLRNIKDDARAAAANFGGRAKGVDQTIDYTVDDAFAGGAGGEVGYRRDMPKGGIPLETGTRFTAPRPVLREALEQNMQGFIDGVGKAVKDTLK